MMITVSAEGLLAVVFPIAIVLLFFPLRRLSVSKKMQTQSSTEGEEGAKRQLTTKAGQEQKTGRTFNDVLLYSIYIIVFLILAFFLFFSFQSLQNSEGKLQPVWPFFLFLLFIAFFCFLVIDFYRLRSKRAPQKEMRKL